MLSQFALDLLSEQQTVGIHGEQDSRDRQIGVIVSLDLADGDHQLRQTLQRVEFALHRHHNTVTGGQRVHGQHTQRRRAVYDDVIIFASDKIHRLTHNSPRLGIIALKQVKFGARKAHIGRNQGKFIEIGLNNRIFNGASTHQNVFYGILQAFFGDTDTAGGVTLGIQIHKQGVISQHTQRCGNIHRRRGFAHAALLVCKRNNFAHVRFPPLY